MTRRLSDSSFKRLVIVTVLVFALSCVAIMDHTQKVSAITLPVVSKIEITDPCTLKDVTCPTEKAPVAPTKTVVKVQAVNVVQTTSNSKIEISKAVCASKGFTNDCWKVLYAMHLQETTGDCNRIGDQGRSVGCFQIQVKMHKVSRVCATNYECSAKWTLNHLIAHGYPEYRGRSIQLHNGSGPMAVRYYQEVKYRISNL